MARANLGQLLGNAGGKATPQSPKATQVEAPRSARDEPGAKGTSTLSTEPPPVQAAHADTVSIDDSGPSYLRYVRKETRLREDQQNELTLQARRLNRAKKTQGARITENSLTRVAVDILLTKIERASGDDEDAIRKSISKGWARIFGLSFRRAAYVYPCSRGTGLRWPLFLWVFQGLEYPKE